MKQQEIHVDDLLFFCLSGSSTRRTGCFLKKKLNDNEYQKKYCIPKSSMVI